MEDLFLHILILKYFPKQKVYYRKAVLILGIWDDIKCI